MSVNNRLTRGDRAYLEAAALTTIVVAAIVVVSMVGVGALAISPSEEEMGTIHGVVTFEDGTPADGALVFVDGEEELSEVTDGDGAFEILVQPGTYEVFAFDEESGAASEEVQIEVAAGETVSQDLTLATEDAPPPDDGDEVGWIEGTVTDDDGNPVEGALVQAIAGDLFFTDETDGDGTYQIEVDPGTYDVEAFHEESTGFAEPESVSVNVDESVTHDIELEYFDDEGGIDGSDYVADLSVEHVGGTAPSEMPEIEAFDSADGQISIDLMDYSQEEWPQELAGLGVDSTTEFEIEIEFDDFEPRAVVASAQDVDMSIDGSTMTIRANPLDSQWVDDEPMLDDWPEGDDDTADFGFDAMVNLLVLNLDFDEDGFDPADHPMEGLTIATDAQAFSMPQYIEGDEDEPDSLEIMIGGPHETVDGAENEGIYQALLPNGLLEHWGVDDPDDLTAAYKGEETDFSASETDDGIFIEIDVSYSVGTVGISPDEPASADATPTPTPANGDEDPTATPPEGADDPTPTPTPAEGDEDSTPTPEDGDAIPGPGMLGTVLVLLGFGVLLRRRSR